MTLKSRLAWLLLILAVEGLLLASFWYSDRHIPPPQKAPARPITVAGEEGFTVLEEYRFVDQASLGVWEEKTFKGQSDYQLMSENQKQFIRASSSDSCSGLYIKTEHAAGPSLHLSWSWRANSFPQKTEQGTISGKKEDDYAARVYAIFPGANFFKSDVIEYVWDESLPVGFSGPSPYSDRIQLYVLQSGPADNAESGWRGELRNIHEDYVKLFGREPRYALGAVALMSDSDNTATASEADFADIQIKIKSSDSLEKGEVS